MINNEYYKNLIDKTPIEDLMSIACDMANDEWRTKHPAYYIAAFKPVKNEYGEIKIEIEIYYKNSDRFFCDDSHDFDDDTPGLSKYELTELYKKWILEIAERLESYL